MKSETLLGFAKLAGFAVAGFVAYKVVSKVIDSGATITQAVTDTIKTDLNPASPENVVYKAVSAVGNTVASDGVDSPWGVRLWEFANPEKVSMEKALTAPTPKNAPKSEQISRTLISNYSAYGMGQASLKPTADSIPWVSKINSQLRNLSLGN